MDWALQDRGPNRAVSHSLHTCNRLSTWLWSLINTLRHSSLCGKRQMAMAAMATMDIVQAFEDQCKDPMKHQKSLLLEVLKAHQGVDAIQGKQAPDSAAEAQHVLEQMPLTTYADYEPGVKAVLAAANSGSEEAFAAACKRISGLPVTAVHMTSGTTGFVKMFPYNDKVHFARIAGAFGTLGAASKTKFDIKPNSKTLGLGFAGPVTTHANGLQLGSSSAVNIRNFAKAAKAPAQDGPKIDLMSTVTHPMELTVGEGSTTAKYYCAWLCALAQAKDVSQFVDTFAGNMLLGCAVLQSQWQALAEDLRQGRLADSVDVGEDVRTAVEGQLGGPCPEAAQQLTEAMAGGSDGLLERLFPNLAHIGAIVTGSHAKYVPQLRTLAPTVAISSGLYGATEGFIGISHAVVQEGPWSVEPGKEGEQAFVLFPSCDCYYEFLHVARDDAVDRGTAVGSAAHGHAAANGGTASNGHSAAGSNGRSTVSSNGNGTAAHNGAAANSGASNGTHAAGNRLSTANGHSSHGAHNGNGAAVAGPDASRLVALDGLELGARYQLVLTTMVGLFRYRMGEVVRVVDFYQRMPVVAFEGRMGQVLNLVAEKFDEAQLCKALADALPPIIDFTCAEDTSDMLNKHYTIFIELPAGDPPSQPAVDKWAAALQQALKARNAAYAELTAGGAIGPVVLRVVSDGSFAALKDRKARGSGSESQYKTPTVLRAPELIEFMGSRVVCEAVAAR